MPIAPSTQLKLNGRRDGGNMRVEKPYQCVKFKPTDLYFDCVNLRSILSHIHVTV